MKLISILGVIFALSGVAVGLKNRICGQKSAHFGYCSGYTKGFTYYPETNECKMFIYGRCAGNKNRFKDKAACEAKCKE
ncbi:chymotrypsin inhibitor SCI-III-like [Drosophila miranda]|uniref:chymotrypsin inhibitor SCI-III-like n=1 Tax=Drosophila miranda TaxID=7229 RepID=UPI0007E88BF0|nr:chymotrypsin inhibitor SCI-III-like [Drosophila miranda]